MSALLRQFGGAHWDDRNARDPIWRLQNDAIWQVSDVGRIEMEAGSGRPRIASLRRTNPETFFTPAIAEDLRDHPEWIPVLARDVLEAAFSPTLHAGIAQSAGVMLAPRRLDRTVLERDAAFRDLVLDAYEARCAFCGFADRLSGKPFAVEAAHVRWHCNEGPSTLENGLCLCALHHLAFDSGAVCVSERGLVLVSAHVAGGAPGGSALMNVHRRPVDVPCRGDRVSDRHFAWNRAERFREPAA